MLALQTHFCRYLSENSDINCFIEVFWHIHNLFIFFFDLLPSQTNIILQMSVKTTTRLAAHASENIKLTAVIFINSLKDIPQIIGIPVLTARLLTNEDMPPPLALIQCSLSARTGAVSLLLLCYHFKLKIVPLNKTACFSSPVFNFLLLRAVMVHFLFLNSESFNTSMSYSQKFLLLA